MKIDDIISEQKIDELDAGQVGQALGKGTKAVGTGISNFAKGFKAGFTGQGAASGASKPAASAAPKGAPAKAVAGTKGPLDDIKAAITKLQPKQIAALRKQIAQKAGVA